MERIAEHLLPRADLDDLAEIHHGHPVADVLHRVQVVRNEEIGEAEPRLKVAQQADDRRSAQAGSSAEVGSSSTMSSGSTRSRARC